MAHPNIIRLLGYCRDEAEHLLVYEYMPNKSFDRVLFSAIGKRLSWGKRLLIMIGVARGLTYMHSRNIIHRDLKSSDILLDEDFDAKLGDFGLVKYGPETGGTHVTTRVMETYGYAAPEKTMFIDAQINVSILNPIDQRQSHLTTKSDIHGFGMVLFESILGRRGMDASRLNGERSLVEWASSIQSNKRNLKEIIDPRLDQHSYHIQGASKCFALALRCVANNPNDRPSGEEVLHSLLQIYYMKYC
ncbi:putative serine/threonine-protein kinase PBL17 [Bidens hawaiensis]|uniref:putative serine/threonine-protein kinase PBL17 n=1 Tax=Bidens hawaiensis TaxID=980011 RepID=UPI00404995AD